MAAICLLAACARLGCAAPAAADDWSLTRKPGAPRHAGGAPAEARGADALARQERLFREHPHDAAILERLLALLADSEGGAAGFAAALARESEAHPEDARLAEAAARVLARVGQREQAGALLGRFETQGHCADGPGLLHSELLLAGGDVQAALSLLRALVACVREPRGRRQVRESLANLLLAQGEISAAREAFEALAADAPGDAGARRKWPEALARVGRAREAGEALLALATRDQAPLLRDAALEFIRAGELDLARASLARAARRASPSERAELAAIEEQAERAAGHTAELAERLSASSHAADVLRAAKLWDELGDSGRAESGYRAWLAHSARDLDVLERLARLYVRSGKREQAAALYEKLVAASPTDMARLGAYAELLRGLGREPELLALLERGARHAGGSAAAQAELLELYARLGQVAAQRQALQRLVQLEPRESAHVVALGELQLEQGEREAALATWRTLLARDPQRVRGLATLADVLGDHDMLDEAVGSMERALELEPEDLALRRKYASLLERAGRSQAAERAWQWVLERAAHDAEAGREARAHLVSLWKRQGVVPIRARELAEHMRAAPGDHAVLRLLAELFARDPKRAETELALIDRMAVWGQSDPELLRALAALHTRRGDAERALPLLEKLAELAPESALDYLTRAVELALSQYRDAAAAYYAERALALRPQDAAAFRLAGSVHLRRQQLEQASAAYARAAELEPRDIATWVKVAELAESRADPEAATAAFLRVLAQAEADDQVIAAAHKLMASQAPRAAQRLEEALLEALRRAPERAVFRRLLVEWYGRALSAGRAGDARASKREPREQERVWPARLSLRPLLESLEDPDAALRHTAIALLAAARPAGAAPALLAFAQKSTSHSERAEALVALGRIGAPASAPELRVLLGQLPAPLKPVALWALVATLREGASDDCRALLADPEAAVRAVAALALGALAAPVEPALQALLSHERHPAVRAAALGALAARATGDSTRLFEAGLDAPWPIPAAALWGLRRDQAQLARALLAEEPRLRSNAAQLWGRDAQAAGLPHAGERMGRAPVSADEQLLDPPSWPFDARAYVAAQLTVRADGAPAQPALSAASGQQIGAALAAALDAGGARAGSALDALAPGAPLPRALQEQGFCATQAFSAALLRAAREALDRLAADRQSPLFARVLLVLAQGGASAHPAVLDALAPNADPTLRAALLGALAGERELAVALRAQLLRLYDAAPDWPTRLRVAEVLGAGLGPVRVGREPVALVRAAIRELAPPGAAGRSCRAPTAAN